MLLAVDQSNPQIHSSTTIIAQSSLTIKNVENFAVLFKIQTTSPLHYRVKPSHGRIEAGETKDINSETESYGPLMVFSPTILSFSFNVVRFQENRQIPNKYCPHIRVLGRNFARVQQPIQHGPRRIHSKVSPKMPHWQQQFAIGQWRWERVSWKHFVTSCPDNPP